MKTEGKVLASIAVAFFVLTFLVPAAFAVPQTINYQGRLMDSGGTPVNAHVSMDFAIYDVPTKGTALWTETQSSVTVTDGAFSVVLGSVTPINLPFDVQYYLGVKVDPDLVEMTPRAVLVTVPYAMRAAKADWVDIANDAVTAPKIGIANIAIVAERGGHYDNPAVAMDPANWATWCGTPSVAHRCLLKIMPGAYYIGSSTIALRNYIDIEGSGTKSTGIYGTGPIFNDGLVGGNADVEIRSLSVETTGQYAILLNTYWGYTVKITDVSATGAEYAVYSIGASLDISHSELTGTNYAGVYMDNENITINPTVKITDTKISVNSTSDAYGIYARNATVSMDNVDISAIANVTGIGYGIYARNATVNMNNADITAVGTSYSYGIVDGYGSTVNIYNTRVTASGGAEAFAVHAGYGGTASTATVANSDITATGGTTMSYGLYTTSTGSKAYVDSSKLKAVKADSTAGYAIDAGSGSNVYVGASKVDGGAYATGALVCVGAYGGSYVALNTLCQ